MLLKFIIDNNVQIHRNLLSNALLIAEDYGNEEMIHVIQEAEKNISNFKPQFEFDTRDEQKIVQSVNFFGVEYSSDSYDDYDEYD